VPLLTVPGLYEVVIKVNAVDGPYQMK